MQLVLQAPSQNRNAIQWIVRVILTEFLGVPYRIQETSGNDFQLHANGKILYLPNCFFKLLEKRGAHTALIPTPSTLSWIETDFFNDIPRSSRPYPLLFGTQGIELSEDSIRLGVDIFGTAFFMLSRYEEIVLPDRDKHGRFPAASSLALKAGFLDRPIVDEYVEILWAAMKYLWPGLKRKKRSGKVRVTCDVDAPFDPRVGDIKKVCLTLAADALLRRSGKLMFSDLKNYCARLFHNYHYDQNYTFDWYMDECEKAGRQVTFYFIASLSKRITENRYQLDNKDILKLIHHIASRGHKLGVHGSYCSFDSAKQIKEERKCMEEVCARIGVKTSLAGVRQHFLRWDAGKTPDNQDDAGFDYDSTGSYADNAGFRYGTSRAFTMWSWQKRKALKIKQRPLILMECSVLADCYMGFGYTDSALKRMEKLKHRSIKYGGDFTLLWHNSHLRTKQDRTFFVELLK